MADLFSLKDNNETSTIDLLSGTYKLRDRAWATSTPSIMSDFEAVPFGAHPAFQNFVTQTETLDLIAQETTHSTIRAAQRDISEALEAARLYCQHPLWTVYSATSGSNPWWLHWNIDGETEKRSLIYEGSLATINENCAEPFISSDVSLLRLAITRHPFWEPIVSESSSASETTISCFGGTSTITDVPGDTWARMASAYLQSKSGSGPIYRTWWGIREKMAGTANFEPVWELEDGSLFNGASVNSSDADDSGDNVEVSPPAATLTQYITITVGEVCAANSHTDYDHQIGEYLVLCRVKVDAGTVGLQMRYGFDSGTMAPCEEVFITNTSYRLIELGNITIPPTGDINITGAYAQFTEVQIYAEQVSGTSVLNLDALILIPTHHFWYAQGGQLGTGINDSHLIVTTPDDRFQCHGRESLMPRYALEYNIKDWYLPTGDSIAVVAGEQQNFHVLTDNLGLQIYYYPRWGMYRGLGGT